MYRITKEFAFEASHALRLLPEWHKCSRNHGHSYRVVIELRSRYLDENGFVLDYGDLDPIKQYIDKNLDHHYLNEVLEMDQTTAEKIAEHLYGICKELWGNKVYAVSVSETQKTWATYFEEPDPNISRATVKEVFYAK